MLIQPLNEPKFLFVKVVIFLITNALQFTTVLSKKDIIFDMRKARKKRIDYRKINSNFGTILLAQIARTLNSKINYKCTSSL